MESSEHSGAHISSPICTNSLIFNKGTIFFLFFLNMLTNPIISQIKFLWHYNPLLLAYDYRLTHNSILMILHLYPLKESCLPYTLLLYCKLYHSGTTSHHHQTSKWIKNQAILMTLPQQKLCHINSKGSVPQNKNKKWNKNGLQARLPNSIKNEGGWINFTVKT